MAAKKTTGDEMVLNTLFPTDKQEQSVPVEEKKQGKLFDIINALFTNPDYISNLTYESANQNIFMVLRRMAIAYPLQANAFNIPGVNPLDCLKFWSDYLRNIKKPPRWVYVTGANKQQEKKISDDDITKKEISDYLKETGQSRKDFEFALKIFHDDAVSEIREHFEFNKTLKQLKEQ